MMTLPATAKHHDELATAPITVPSILVVSMGERAAGARSRFAEVVRNRASQGAVTASCHWKSAQIRVSASGGNRKSLPLAAVATRLLYAAGLTQAENPAHDTAYSHRFDLAMPEPQPPTIRVSIPAHFGVELMLLTGAALRPLADRGVLFIGSCGTIDSSLRNFFDTAGLDALTRFANQLPKHRIDELYPLFFLIGASGGVARGVLDHVVAERATSTEPAIRGRRDVRTRAANPVTDRLIHTPM